MLALALAEASYRLVEQPLRHAPRLMASPKRSLALTLGLTALGALVSVGVAGWAVSATHSGVQARYLAARTSYAESHRPGCYADLFDTYLKSCAFGDTASATRVVVYGDSHAEQWLSSVIEVGKAHGWRVESLTKNGCPPVDVPITAATLGRL